MEAAASPEKARTVGLKSKAPPRHCLLCPGKLARMMPHVIFIEPAGRSGIAQFVYGLANALGERGLPVTVVTARWYELESYPKAFRVERVFDAYRTNPINVLFLLKRLTRQQPSVVDFHGATHPELYLPLLWTIKQLIRAKIIYSAHDPAPRHWLQFPQAILKWMYRIPHHIHALNTNTQAILIQRYAVPPSRVSLIPFANCLYLAQDVPTDHPKNDQAPRHPVILFLGFITPNKGLLDLIHAFAQVRKAIPHARLCIAGQPVEPFEKYAQAIEQLGLSQAVDTHLAYLPFEKIHQLLRQCAVVALPYHSASQSGVIQLAYAYKKAIVATDCPGLANHIVDGKSGILVPVGNVEALSTALIEVLANEPQRQALGCYGRWLAETRFSWDHTVQHVRQIYESLCASHQATIARS